MQFYIGDLHGNTLNLVKIVQKQEHGALYIKTEVRFDGSGDTESI